MTLTFTLCDWHVAQYVGLPLVKLKSNIKLCGGDRCQVKSPVISGSLHRSHQDSWSPVVNKNKVRFDNTVGFVTSDTLCSSLPVNASVDISDPVAYFHLASAVKASGVPNHKGMRVPLPSTFDLEYIKKEICGYHDLDPSIPIISNKTDNHASAGHHAEAIDEYIALEKQHGALLGPFKAKLHDEFTWSI